MARKRHIIRKTLPTRYRRVDDQLWPLVVALVVLGGFLAGSVLAYLRLDDSRWYANAWTWLIAIPLVIAAALLALAWTGNRWLRRTMQLSMVLGVIVHVVLFLAAVETDVFDRVWTEMLAAADRPRQKRTVKVPDFLSWQHDPQRRTLRDLQQPVEVHVPDPVPEQLPREQPQSPPPDTDLPPPPAPKPEDRPLPSVVDRAEPNQAVPRQRQEMSKLSRREAMRVPDRPTQLVELPSVVPQPERREQSPQPEIIGLRPPTRADTPQRQPTHPPAEAPTGVPPAPLGRRPEPTQPAPEPSAPAALARREHQLVVEPRAVAEAADRRPDAPESPLPSPQPQAMAAEVLRQQTRAPDAREAAETPPTDITAESATPRRNVEQPSPSRETLAKTPRSVPNRQPRVTTRPDLTAMVDRLPDSSAAPPATLTAEPSTTVRVDRDQVGPIATTDPGRRAAAGAATEPTVDAPQVAKRLPAVQRPELDAVGAALPGRRPAASPSLGALSQRVSPEASVPGATEPSQTLAGPPGSADTQIAKRAAGNASPELHRPSAETIGASIVDQTPVRHTQRLRSAGAPSLSAVPDSDASPRRALHDASIAASPRVAEAPSHAASTADHAPPTAEPASMALTKAEIGTAGRGAARNLGQADPSSASPAAVASGSAQRAQATQDLPPGPAIEPQDAAVVRRGRAGLARPSTVLEANAVDPALMAGSRQPADIQASTSAALTRAASDAEQGRVTASKGSLDVDAGPTTLVAEAGAGRGAGGGQPEPSSGTRHDFVPRAQTGRAPSPSLLADTSGPATAAPSASGGGEPSAAAVDAGADTLVGARTGPELASFGGPRALGGGPESVPTPSPARAVRRDHGVLDERPQPDAAQGGVARAVRKESANRQLPVDLGIADVNAGDAADRTDEDLPSSTLAASDAAIPGTQRVTQGVGGGPSGQIGAAAIADSAPAASPTDLAGRAEAVESAAGLPAVGGGTGSPPRSARGPAVAAGGSVDTIVEIAGMPGAQGTDTAPPSDGSGPAVPMDMTRDTNAVGDTGPVTGRVESDVARVVVGANPGSGPSRPDRAPAVGHEPVVGDDAHDGKPGKRSSRLELPGDVAAVDMSDVVSPSDVVPGQDADVTLAIGDPQSGPVSRLAGQALPADIAAPAGIGGLGSLASVDVGLATRRASEARADIQLDTPRFNRNRVGGPPNLSRTAAIPTESFQRRIQRAQGVGEPAEGAGPQTEDAIELGLVFLSKAQLPDGRWSLDRFAKEDGLPQLASDSAATGLALLAFQGAGYNHLDFRYAEVVRRGLDFLLKNQQPDGSLFVPMDEESNRVVQFYSHSIAALAMCEAYGMTQDSMLREPAQRAIDFIVETQNSQRGGWRYTADVGSDTSVTGWMMMALKSGELANLKVPKETYRAIDQWLDTAQASPTQPHLYCYNPFAPDTAEQRTGRAPTPTMTSVGLLMRLYLGWRRNNPAFARGALYLAQRPPAIGTQANPQRDTYYWYYGTQVMFHMGGQYWRDWNHALHPLLVDAQIRDGELAGSWDPRRPIPDRWAAHAGRLYVTTMNLLSLEVTYRHLPLYEDTAK